MADRAEAVWPEVHEFRGGNRKHFATALVSRDGRLPTSYSGKVRRMSSPFSVLIFSKQELEPSRCILGRHYGGWCMVPDSSEELELRGGSPRLCQAISKNYRFEWFGRPIDGAYFLVQRQFESPDDQLNPLSSSSSGSPKTNIPTGSKIQWADHSLCVRRAVMLAE